jgi:nucleoside-diphosphate-sugar epimerase
MNVVITGGAGFLGRRLARKLLERGDVEGLTLVDVVAAQVADDRRVRMVSGDIADPAVVRDVIEARVDSVFHLVAVVSGQAERAFDLGMRVNLDASRALLEACRATQRVPRVLFTSSVAVYGGDLPALVTDATRLDPRSSYGVQKAIGELMLCDYTRKGFVDGRIARLPTISVRPGRPNQAASSFASGIIREPLSGEEAVCPVARQLAIWLLSPRRAIDCLIALQDLAGDALGAQRMVNLPGLSVTVAQMIDALRAVGGERVAQRIRFAPDAAIERIVGSWPGAWDTSRAQALGLRGDASFEDVVRAHVEDELHGKIT